MRAAALLAADESIEALRLRLSRLDKIALAEMPWLAAALGPEWEIDDLTHWVENGTAVSLWGRAPHPSPLPGGEGIGGSAPVGGESNGPIGVAVAVLGAPAADAASVPFIAIEPGRRFRGLGGEAALALERYLRERFGVERVYAPVPDGRGLAVYFWLRLGYRPLLQTEAPWPLVGLTAESKPGIWMVRGP